VVVPDYLGILLHSAKDELEGMASGSTNQTELSADSILAIPILLPPLDEQRRIVDIISAVDDQASTADSLTIALRTLRSALLADLLSGDHEIPASYDLFLSA
jgi:type I restriction enzyme S subunit